MILLQEEIKESNGWVYQQIRLEAGGKLVDKNKFRRDISTLLNAKKRAARRAIKDKENDVSDYTYSRNKRCTHTKLNISKRNPK